MMCSMASLIRRLENSMGRSAVAVTMPISWRRERLLYASSLVVLSSFASSEAFILGRDPRIMMEMGFFHGYNMLIWIMILNHALSGIAVSLVIKYADNIVKVYSTSIAMVFTAVMSIPMFGFEITLPFILGTCVLSVAIYLHNLNTE